MSAFICSERTFSALIWFAHLNKVPYFFDWKFHEVNIDTRELVGQKLVDENYLSFNHRYSEAETPFTFNLIVDESVIAASENPVQVLKLCDCYDYQACETDGYPKSEAHEIIEAIRHKAINLLPGYEDASWDLQ